MKKRYYTLLYILCLFALSSCSDSMESEQHRLVTLDLSTIQADVEPFAEVREDGRSVVTRANIEGTQFEPGDLMRLRIIAPFVTSTEYGESTWSSSYDNWRLYKWNAPKSNWTAASGFDINNDLNYNTTSPTEIAIPQATPFVFTATTWTEEIHHVISTPDQVGGKLISSFSNIFKADQRNIKDYKASDVLWAQQYMQTGTDNVRLSFQHKMAALLINISNFAGELTGSEEVILSLEGMPDIDQQEVTIGNYYANNIKGKDAYGDYNRTKCAYEDNGKVLGIAVVDQEVTEGIKQVPILDFPQDGVYLAYKQDAYTFLLIIPPYNATGKTPTLWLRQGEKRWNVLLPLPANKIFESGKRYSVTMEKPVVTTPEGDNNDNSTD